MKTDAPQPQSMSDILDQMVESTEGEEVRVEEFLQALGVRSHGPLLLFTSLIELFPLLGAIPGAYIVVALIVILLAGQLLLRRPHPWLPKKLRDFAVSRKKLVRSVQRMRPWAARIDWLVSPRLTFFLRPPFVQLIALICIVMALLFFPLAFIPSSEKVLAAPVFFFGLALTANDGLLALVGLVVTAAIVILPLVYWDELMQALPTTSSIA